MAMRYGCRDTAVVRTFLWYGMVVPPYCMQEVAATLPEWLTEKIGV